jgi:hypothetical protein
VSFVAGTDVVSCDPGALVVGVPASWGRVDGCVVRGVGLTVVGVVVGVGAVVGATVVGDVVGAAVGGGVEGGAGTVDGAGAVGVGSAWACRVAPTTVSATAATATPPRKVRFRLIAHGRLTDGL